MVNDCRGIDKQVAYKLFSLNKDGTLSPLFINKNQIIDLDVWLESECYPTKGFAIRQGWHCTLLPLAPHLKMILKQGKPRVWCEVEVMEYTPFKRPQSQGGEWLLANKMKVNKILSNCEIDNILKLSTREA